MGKPRKADRPIQFKVNLPESLLAELTIRLWSEAEGRIPYGVQSKFIEEAIREKLSRARATEGAMHGNQS